MALIKKYNDKPEVIANKSVIDHNQLANREQYGAHPISAIRGLPEKLTKLKNKDEELEGKIETTSSNLSKLTEKVDEVESNAKKIDIVENAEDGTFTFTNYGATDSKTIQSGYQPDEDTLTLNDSKKMTLKQVHTDNSLEGKGTQEDPLLVNIDNTTITKRTDGKLEAISLKTNGDSISGITIKEELDNLNKDVGDLSTQLNADVERLDAHNAAQDNEIYDLQSRTKGMGGYLNSYNFGDFSKLTPEEIQSDLTAYALQETGAEKEVDIFNGTKVINDYDRHLWRLTNTPDSNPVVFEWADLGITQEISTATDSLLGLVKGSNGDLKGKVDINGEISINGLKESLDDKANLIEQNDFEGINNFNAETNFNEQVNVQNHNIDIHNGYISTTDDIKDLVTKYSADEIVIENGTGENAKTYNLTLPLKSGTLGLAEDIDNISKEIGNKQDALTAGENITIKDNIISSTIPTSSATVLGGVYLYKIGDVWNIDTSGNDPAVRIPEGTTIVENAMLKSDMEVLYIPSSVTQNNASINKQNTYINYRELHCDMDLEQFLNIQVGGYTSSLGGYYGSGVNLYLKEVKQDSITILNKYGITTLGYQLCGLGMTELTLEEGIERIQGIEYCTNLTTLHLPVSLKTIDSYGLARNTNLKDVYYAGTKSQWYQITLGANYNQGCLFDVIHCSDGDLDLVIKGPVVTVPDGVTTLTLANLATDMETLIIPDSLTSCNARIIKTTYKVYNRLETTKSLEEFLAITVANDDYRNAIGGYAGSSAANDVDLVINGNVQTTITVPGTIKDAGYNLSSLSITELTLEEGVEILGCAGYCHNLTTVNLPSTLTTIGNRGFYNCANLETLNYAGTMAQWANVSLNNYWHRSTPLTVVHCSDGDVTL